VDVALYRPQQSLIAVPLSLALFLSFVLVLRQLWNQRNAASPAHAAEVSAA
jgi:hypothetical protein